MITYENIISLSLLLRKRRDIPEIPITASQEGGVFLPEFGLFHWVETVVPDASLSGQLTIHVLELLIEGVGALTQHVHIRDSHSGRAHGKGLLPRTVARHSVMTLEQGVVLLFPHDLFVEQRPLAARYGFASSEAERHVSLGFLSLSPHLEAPDERALISAEACFHVALRRGVFNQMGTVLGRERRLVFQQQFVQHILRLAR